MKVSSNTVLKIRDQYLHLCTKYQDPTERSTNTMDLENLGGAFLPSTRKRIKSQIQKYVSIHLIQTTLKLLLLQVAEGISKKKFKFSDFFFLIFHSTDLPFKTSVHWSTDSTVNTSCNCLLGYKRQPDANYY